MNPLPLDQALDALSRIAQALDQALVKTLAKRPEGLAAPEVRLLMAAGLAEGRPLKDLAARLGLSRPSVSLTAEALVAKGFLDRSPGADRREVMVRLTVRGWEVFRDVRAELVDRLGLSAWSGSDLERLADISIRI